MTIGELARRAGVRPSAIRYYESAGLIPPPPRISKRRVYHPDAVTVVQTINVARTLGFTIREIRTLVRDGQPKITERWRTLAERKLPELQELIGRATRMQRMLQSALACSCVRIEDCILHDCSPPIPASRLRSRGLRSASR